MVLRSTEPSWTSRVSLSFKQPVKILPHAHSSVSYSHRANPSPVCVCAADSTGTHSLYTRYQDYEIMFHVSTMLPYTDQKHTTSMKCLYWLLHIISDWE
uniref:Rap-GAP domain-containing protein n=1 Tax=Anguilla anguilla TaxID=7936 RepID=A0A0E9PEN8_ANGAN